MHSGALNTAELGRIDRRPMARWSVSTEPWPMNGPMPGSTPATRSAARRTSRGYTPTITTAATQHSAVNHQPAVYLTSQVSTTSRGMPARACAFATRRLVDPWTPAHVRVVEGPGARARTTPTARCTKGELVDGPRESGTDLARRRSTLKPFSRAMPSNALASTRSR